MWNYLEIQWIIINCYKFCMINFMFYIDLRVLLCPLCFTQIIKKNSLKVPFNALVRTNRKIKVKGTVPSKQTQTFERGKEGSPASLDSHWSGVSVRFTGSLSGDAGPTGRNRSRVRSPVAWSLGKGSIKNHLIAKPAKHCKNPWVLHCQPW